jgi:class 3 adenylate cyclase/tetratricopeptide (TPR) repeat protein
MRSPKGHFVASESEILTFLFTDVEDSTRLWEEHPDEMRDALARHDAILHGAVVANGGRVVKSTGDGMYAVFAAAPAAVASAKDALRALDAEPWGATGPLRVRMAVHSGPAQQRAGDYFGPTLNRTSRLSAAAHGGQVLLSLASAEAVRLTLAEDLDLLDLGEHRLRGLTKSERVYQLLVAGLRAQFPPLRTLDALPEPLELPVPSFGRRDVPLAGRSSELELMEKTWARASAGRWQVAFVAGEPGIGKTRLAAELAHRAHEGGAVVLYGRCDEEGIVPYQPFVEALRLYVAASPVPTLHERLHGLEIDLGRLFPELSGRLAEPTATPTDREAERYRLFEAVAALLSGIAVTAPTLMVLDDLHWADKPTMLLLRHIVRSSHRGALLIVVCYRDVELGVEHPLRDMLADFRREEFVTRLELSGLSHEESSGLARDLVGREVPARLLAALHQETEGNPFFLEELVRHLTEADANAAFQGDAHSVERAVRDLPESVREVIDRRLRRIGAPVKDLLALAAVIGHEFDPAVLRRATGDAVDRVLGLLDEAIAAGLLHESPDGLRYAFSHAVIRQTVNAAVGPARLAHLHAKVAQALERTGTGSAGELALHFAAAAPLLGSSKAIEYTAQAGNDALADLAFEEAAQLFTRALELLERDATADADLRVGLQIARAGALVFVDERAGVEAARDAIMAARSHGLGERLAEAAAVFVEATYTAYTYPEELIAVLDEARDVLRERSPALRARLLAFEAFKAATYQLDGRDGRPIADEAVRLARLTDDPVALADALFARAVTLEGHPDVTERLAIGQDLVGIGRAARGRASAFGLRVLAGAQLEIGDAGAARSTVAALERLGDELRWLPANVYASQWSATLAQLEGRFDDARAAVHQLRGQARAYRGAVLLAGMQAFFIARQTGDIEPARPGRGPAAESLFARSMLALAQYDNGDLTAASHALDQALAGGASRGEHESGFGAALAMLVEVAVGVDARHHIAELYTALVPFSGRLICGFLGLTCFGAADRYLGMLATADGQWKEASVHFERALELEAQAGANGLRPRTYYWQAVFLRARGVAGDREAARAALEQAAREATRLGMKRLRADAEALLNH